MCLLRKGKIESVVAASQVADKVSFEGVGAPVYTHTHREKRRDRTKNRQEIWWMSGNWKGKESWKWSLTCDIKRKRGTLICPDWANEAGGRWRRWAELRIRNAGRRVPSSERLCSSRIREIARRSGLPTSEQRRTVQSPPPTWSMQDDNKHADTCRQTTKENKKGIT